MSPSVPVAPLPMPTHYAPVGPPAATIISQTLLLPPVCSTAASCDLSGMRILQRELEFVWQYVREKAMPTTLIRPANTKTQSPSPLPAHPLTSRIEPLGSASSNALRVRLQTETHAIVRPAVRAYTMQTPFCKNVRFPARPIYSSI